MLQLPSDICFFFVVCSFIIVIASLTELGRHGKMFECVTGCCFLWFLLFCIVVCLFAIFVVVCCCMLLSNYRILLSAVASDEKFTVIIERTHNILHIISFFLSLLVVVPQNWCFGVGFNIYFWLVFALITL